MSLRWASSTSSAYNSSPRYHSPVERATTVSECQQACEALPECEGVVIVRAGGKCYRKRAFDLTQCAYGRPADTYTFEAPAPAAPRTPAPGTQGSEVHPETRQVPPPLLLLLDATRLQAAEDDRAIDDLFAEYGCQHIYLGATPAKQRCTWHRSDIAHRCVGGRCRH